VEHQAVDHHGIQLHQGRKPADQRPEAWGIAQYVAYSLTDTITLNARGEVFRDGKGFFVAYFPGNLDFVNAQYGKPNTASPARTPPTANSPSAPPTSRTCRNRSAAC